MEALVKFYEKEMATLKEAYAKYVESNKKIHGLALALRQIKNEGDTSVAEAESVLNCALCRERKFNESMSDRCYSLKAFVRRIELELEANGYEANQVEELFGY